MDGKKPEIVFAPGCFDDFDGTQEELQDLIAHLHQMVEDGSLFTEATPVPDDEADKIMLRIERKQNRQ